MGTIQISGLNSKSTFDSTDVIAIESNGVTYKVSGSTLASALKTLGNYLNTASLVANLTTTTAGSPLDATQGKALADLLANIISSTSVGTYTDLSSAAAGVWGVMDDGAIKIGRFLRSGVSYYIFAAYKNSDNFATMLCWSYGTLKMYMINKVQGTIQTPAEFAPTT